VLRESFVEIFVAIVDQNNTRCVASDAMRANMHRIIVSGKGPVGHHARKLWKGGYTMVLDSIQASLVNYNNVNMQVVCPECLGHGNPRRASTWSWDEVCAAAEDRSQASIVCRRGHRVKSNLLCGTCKDETTILDAGHSVRTAKPVSEILPAVVLVGLWDGAKREIRNVGSGFIVDKRLGLIVTAAHVLFNMQEGRQYGTQYFGLRDARVVIGVIPAEGGGNRAVFRYFGEIVTSNVDSNVDACIVRMTTKMEHDVDDEGQGCSLQPEIVLDTAKIKDENLARLKMETDYVLEETVRVVGFNQGGGGLLEPGRHVLRNADFAQGYICGRFDLAISDDSSASSDAGSRSFLPNQEIICMLPTIAGHSGSPCVNDDGLVVGILSRADPGQKDRCYLVPANQLKDLLKRARSVCSRPVYPVTRPHLSKLTTM
jgi:Trypsin-like peptidase domain